MTLLLLSFNMLICSRQQTSCTRGIGRFALSKLRVDMMMIPSVVVVNCQTRHLQRNAALKPDCATQPISPFARVASRVSSLSIKHLLVWSIANGSLRCQKTDSDMINNIPTSPHPLQTRWGQFSFPCRPIRL